VFDGAALVEGGGAQLTVRAGARRGGRGRRAHRAAPVADGFDDWAARATAANDSAPPPLRDHEMTGYEDLDRYGNWSDDSEYGPLWYPSVAADWVPYRDGRWTWIAPWGWTWVDNAPWGYAPFHYGRWVQVKAAGPGPRDASSATRCGRRRWSAGSAAPAGTPPSATAAAIRPPAGIRCRRTTATCRPTGCRRPPLRLNSTCVRDPRRDRADYRQRGLTVVPQDRFGQRGRVDVPRVQQGVPEQLQNRPGWRRDRERDDNNNFREERRERQEEWRRNRQAPTPVPTPMPAPAAVPNMPPVAAAQQAQPPAVPRFERPDRQERGERPERQHRAMPSMPAPMMAAPAQASAPAPRPAMPAPPPVAAASAPAPAPAAPRAQERSGDRGGERGKRQER
jgi:hypothetical protein